MSNHYRYGRLVQTDILPHHNNTWYYKINEHLYEFYSYDTLVGFILYDSSRMFVEWAHTEHYSVTTSKQCTILANELKKRYAFVHCKVSREIGLKYLDDVKKSTKGK